MYDTHIVQEGENLEDIAVKYNIPIDELIKANNLHQIYYVSPGQELVIPITESSAFDVYTIVPGDNLYEIAKRFNMSVETLALINGLDVGEYIFPNQKLLVPKPGVSLYITAPGDTISSVSTATGNPFSEILLYNEKIYLLPDQLIAYKRQ